MFSNNSIGLEISLDRVRLALVGGSRTKPVVEAVQETQLPPDTIRISLREPNVLQQTAFVSAVRESFNRLLAKSARTSVSLPDGCGRVMLVDLDTRFKSRTEAADIIRWKLKKNLPFDILIFRCSRSALPEKFP
jgi:type IV pilus assembly protein PilM